MKYVITVKLNFFLFLFIEHLATTTRSVENRGNWEWKHGTPCRESYEATIISQIYCSHCISTAIKCRERKTFINPPDPIFHPQRAFPGRQSELSALMKQISAKKTLRKEKKIISESFLNEMLNAEQMKNSRIHVRIIISVCRREISREESFVPVCSIGILRNFQTQKKKYFWHLYGILDEQTFGTFCVVWWIN